MPGAKSWKHNEVNGAPVVHKRDQINSIASAIGRATFEGRLAVVTESETAKEQIAALLDLVYLHLCVTPSPDGVALLVDSPKPEAVAALETLSQSCGDMDIALRQFDDATSSWVHLDPSGFEPASAMNYRGWDALLSQDFSVPPLVSRLVEAIDTQCVRAYPQLTAKGVWSVRVGGLEVGRVKGDCGSLAVGKPGAERDSKKRAAWVAATQSDVPLKFDTATLDMAVVAIKAFAAHWSSIALGHDEHLLESRILSGEVKVSHKGDDLQRIKDDDVVNWGSQFPTKWGPSGRARYLDALLRDPHDGAVPWAIEIKVGTGGQGRYYRHGVAQAVLYRDFIRRAQPLHGWFDQFGLDPTHCQAALVTPSIGKEKWRDRLQNLCDCFGVSLMLVDPEDACYSVTPLTSP